MNKKAKPTAQSVMWLFCDSPEPIDQIALFIGQNWFYIRVAGQYVTQIRPYATTGARHD